MPKLGTRLVSKLTDSYLTKLLHVFLSSCCNVISRLAVLLNLFQSDIYSLNYANSCHNHTRLGLIELGLLRGILDTFRFESDYDLLVRPNS